MLHTHTNKPSATILQHGSKLRKDNALAACVHHIESAEHGPMKNLGILNLIGRNQTNWFYYYSLLTGTTGLVQHQISSLWIGYILLANERKFYYMVITTVTCCCRSAPRKHRGTKKHPSTAIIAWPSFNRSPRAPSPLNPQQSSDWSHPTTLQSWCCSENPQLSPGNCR